MFFEPSIFPLFPPPPPQEHYFHIVGPCVLPLIMLRGKRGGDFLVVSRRAPPGNSLTTPIFLSSFIPPLDTMRPPAMLLLPSRVKTSITNPDGPQPLLLVVETDVISLEDQFK